MNVVEQIKNHPLYAFTVLLIPIIVGVWYLSEALRVNPKQEQIALREAQKADLERQITALKGQVTDRDRQILALKEQLAKSPNPMVPAPSSPPPVVSESPSTTAAVSLMIP
jgi:hypothetical protein